MEGRKEKKRTTTFCYEIQGEDAEDHTWNSGGRFGLAGIYNQVGGEGSLPQMQKRTRGATTKNQGEEGEEGKRGKNRLMS